MNIFEQIGIRKPKKNKFDLSHERKQTMHMGQLVPILCQEVIPGDTFNCSSELLIRFTPLQAPIYQRIKAYTHFFFVPDRLVWDEYKDFYTGGKDGLAAPVKPFILMNEAHRSFFAQGLLPDYMGIPPINTGVVTNAAKISALPFRAYNLIWDEYFRDETLQTESGFSRGSGDQTNSTELNKILQTRDRCWEKDYFTSCQIFAQRGGSVLLPMESAVTYRPVTEVSGALAGTNTQHLGVRNNTTNVNRSTSTFDNAGSDVQIQNIQSISNATTTINDFRTAVRLQEWLEKNARGGYRYIEQMLHHFGIVSDDLRMSRPEYLGGGNNPIVISEVLSTFQDAAGAGDPQGTMAGHGIGVAGGHGFGQRMFKEHGYIIGVMSVLPKTGYQQGIPKMFTRFDKFDHAFPEFGQLGEQAVKLKEVWHNPQGVASEGEETFGYQSRYAEYKYQPSTVHGDFRGNLAYWHQGRIFTAKPVLNETFVKSNPDNRIFAVTAPGTHHLYVQLYHSLHATRPLPYYGTPTL